METITTSPTTVSLPTPVPQIPVRDLGRAIAFYQSKLGFSLDWKYEDGIAGLSRDRMRVFLDRAETPELHPVRVWLNLKTVENVDSLHREWRDAGVPIVATPEQKPWDIYEFIAADCDGNSYRVYCDSETNKR